MHRHDRPHDALPLDELFDPPANLVADAVRACLTDDRTALNLPPAPPAEGMAAGRALALVTPYLRASGRNLADPGFLAHMDPPTPWITWVAALLAASTNQNLLHPDTAPAARELERTVVDWLAEVFAMTGGHLVPGSTIANLTALWAARDMSGACTVVASADSHLSVRKAAAMLGMDYRAVEPTGPGRSLTAADWVPAFSGPRGLDPAATVLVLTAGTTGTGALDDLDLTMDSDGRHRPDRPAWVHVDAAWAGPLRFSPTHRHRLDGIDRADSVAVSAHKWLHQPKESAVVLFADAERAHAAVSVDGSYLAVPNVGVLGSHGATAAPLAATLLHLGLVGVAAVVDHGMAVADRLQARIDEEHRLVRLADHASGVVAWRHLDHDSGAIRAAMAHLPSDRAAFVSAVDSDGVTWLRSVAANPFADPDRVVAAVLSAANRLSKSA